MDVPSNLEKTLIDQASAARDNAYAPYSNFKVGAALLTTADDVILGCNIENISFTPTVCAERTAVFKAVSQGKQDFRAIVVVTGDATPTPPCGVCRQVLSEFVDEEFIVILATTAGKVLRYNFGQLLPNQFVPLSQIGTQDVWEEFKEFIIDQGTLSSEQYDRVKDYLNDLDSLESRLETLGPRHDVDMSVLRSVKEKIYKSAQSKSSLENLITEDELAVLQNLDDLVQLSRADQ